MTKRKRNSDAGMDLGSVAWVNAAQWIELDLPPYLPDERDLYARHRPALLALALRLDGHPSCYWAFDPDVPADLREPVWPDTHYTAADRDELAERRHRWLDANATRLNLRRS